MNGSLTILGVLAVSAVVASYLVYRMTARLIESHPEESRRWVDASPNNPSLEQDLEDLLGCVPLVGMKEILYDYLMYDKQIANTCSFIDDQKKFIIQEFENVPHTKIFAAYLRERGFRLDHWRGEVSKFWKELPPFERPEPGIASGGLTVMVNKMLRLLPREELHTMLRSKARYSENFRFLIALLGSPMFIDMCHQIGESSVLRRHFYWAQEAEIEATFALELAYALHAYLTERLV